MQKCPSTVGVVLISMAFTSCGGLALVVGVIVYFVLVIVFAFRLLISVIDLIFRHLQLTKMYENYLEDFVFAAAKTIAQKVLGTDEKDADAAATSADKNKDNEIADTAETSKVIEKVAKDDDSQDEDEEDDEENLSADEEVASIEPDGDFCIFLFKFKQYFIEFYPIDAEKDAELDRMLKETMEEQKKSQIEKTKEEQIKRAEYDAVPDGYNSINFHMTLFIFLVLLTALNLPSVFAWAKNYP